ncbi:glycosyltransferase [Treponema brennaborense]|uniref:Glycosyl transferase family 2 n=1 Tax=Treponema brennaborense (strain DSM 12168 / CIP 105900 / DD5/3) TaxID=906968 RepID=F4LNM8_TREBD|nr:glycosyltransferase [Treponema brennaborense]AEE15882.1 glycosyl transferase family 2 [Treponema brennaborense DSM 12168]
MHFTILQSVYKKDSPDFLEECFTSIATNTLLPECIILVKDGPLTDELESVIFAWQQKLPLYVVGYSENHGLAYALNYGLQFCKTELIARMDSDDICYPDRFEKQVLFFEMHKDTVILGSGIEEFYLDGKGREYRKIRLYPKRTERKSKTLYRGTPIAHPSVMMKTELLKKYKYNIDTKCNEDIDLWLRILGDGYIIKTLQEPLVHFRITDATFHRRSASKAFTEFVICSKYLNTVNGINKSSILPVLKLLTRFLPNKLNKKLYLSKKRENLFLEKYMNLKVLSSYVFMKNGHLFEALLEFEENDTLLIKAKQLDTDINNIIEIPASEVILYKTNENSDIALHV